MDMERVWKLLWTEDSISSERKRGMLRRWREGGMVLSRQAYGFSEVLHKVLRHTIIKRLNASRSLGQDFWRGGKTTTHTPPHQSSPSFSLLLSYHLSSSPLCCSCLSRRHSLNHCLLSSGLDCSLVIEPVENYLETKTSVKLFNYNFPLRAGLKKQ